MTSGTLLDSLQGPAERIGRYFSALSVLPSAALVLYVRLLLATGAWSRPPNWSAALTGLTQVGLAESLQLIAVSLVLGLVLQPLQYAFVQLCEGYWGIGRLAQSLMVAKVGIHKRRVEHLDDIAVVDLQAIEADDMAADTDATARMRHLSRRGEVERLLLEYPRRLDEIRPTRLGNVLRRYESSAGAAYGLPLVSVAPHLVLSAPRTHIAYVEDQRTQLDLAVRLVITGLLACSVTIPLLWDDGLWLLLAVLPYFLGYLAYRGAVVVAGEYGRALTAALDLNRFDLYERLHLPLPDSTASERVRNAELAFILRDRDQNASLSYQHRKSPEEPDA